MTAIIDLVKWEAEKKAFAWKHPSENLSTWTQLIVNETQEAYLVKAGVYDGPFTAGRHTLSTENIPLIRTLMALPFGGRTPFSAEVWYINKLINLDMKWGTPDPVLIRDPEHQIMVPLRAFGQFGVQIANGKMFLQKFVGTLTSFDADNLNEYLRGAIITNIKNEIVTTVANKGVPILDLSAHLSTLSLNIHNLLIPIFDSFGIRLVNFFVNSINFPETDAAVATLRDALAKRAEMRIVGYNYQQERSFDVLQAAAANEGSAGDLLGAGMGLGLGVGIGSPMGSAMGNLGANLLQTGSTTQPKSRLEELKLLTELRSAGALNDAEFEAEKTRILGRKE